MRGKIKQISIKEAINYQTWEEYYLDKQGVTDNNYFLKKSLEKS